MGAKTRVAFITLVSVHLHYIHFKFYSFSRRFYPKQLTIEEYNKQYIIKRQTDKVFVIQISRHCSEKILARR